MDVPKLTVRFFRSGQGSEPVREWLKDLPAAERKRTNPYAGSDFEDFLAEEDRLEESTVLAIKRVLATELDQAMKAGKVSQAELARRMKTSRAVVHRLLDATDPSVTLSTISKAATALGRSVRVELTG